MFECNFDTSNAAFNDIIRGEKDAACLEVETTRILRNIARAISAGVHNGKAIDHNGNVVGEWRLTA